MAPHRILAAVPDPCGLPVASVFRACIVAPRGGPRTEPPRPGGCWPTTSSPYLRGERFLLLFFSAFATSHAPIPPCPLRSAVVARRRSSALRRTRRETPQRFPAHLRLSCLKHFTALLLPRSLFVTDDCEFAQSPATVVFVVLRRLRLASSPF